MLVESRVFDVVPRRRLVALKTLVDSGVRFSRDACRDHLEVHHVMARRCLMTLSTIGRVGRGVPVFGNRPSIGCVALRTILTEQREMTVVVSVTGDTMESCLTYRNVRVWCSAGMIRGDQRRSQCTAFRICRVVAHLSQSNRHHSFVVHVRRSMGDPLMLPMTLRATTDTGMKRRRLSLQQRLVVGMTDDALRCFDAGDGRVAGGTIVLEMRMRCRQGPRFG